MHWCNKAITSRAEALGELGLSYPLPSRSPEFPGSSRLQRQKYRAEGSSIGIVEAFSTALPLFWG